jgi:DNA polymerase
MPASILLIGEAPGLTEDIRGKPFCGPSGEILRHSFEAALRLSLIKKMPSYYITNVVRCRPIDDDGNNRQPTYEEAWACFPNLEQVYIDVKPIEVVFLGNFAEAVCRKAWPHGVRLDHPAMLLRVGGIESCEYLRFIRNLSAIFNRIEERR